MMRTTVAGFTLLELLISLTLLVVVLGSVFTAQTTTGRLSSEVSTSAVLSMSAQEAIEPFVSEIRWAHPGTLLVVTENGSDRVEFSVPTGWNGASIDWSTTIVYAVEPSNYDSNEDGVLDEGRLVRTQGTNRRVLCNHVPLGGFQVERVDDAVDVRLTLTDYDTLARTLVTNDARTSIRLRND